MSDDEVRTATETDLPALPAIEAVGDVLFAAAGLDLPPGVATVAQLRAARCVLVVGDPPVGFARLEEVDGCAHLEQLSVHPDHTGTGLGSRLLEAAVEWAAERGYPRMTLTTFADVAWNAPFYRRRGFRTLAGAGPQLRAHRDAERAAGLDRLGTRVVLVRPLHRTPPSHPWMDTSWFAAYEGLAWPQVRERAVAEGRVLRVVTPDVEAITADLRPDRLTVFLDAEGSLERMWPG